MPRFRRNIYYTYTITDVFGCTYDTSIALNVYPLPDVDLGDDITVCYGDPYPTLDAGVGPLYLWSTGATTQTITPTTAGTYSVTVTNSYGCDNSDTIEVSMSTDILVNAECEPDTICIHQQATLSAGITGGTLPYSYQWLLNGNPYSTSYPLLTNAPGTYILIVTDDNGCQKTDTTSLETINCPIEIPNIITPNGDGNNDVFFLTDYFVQYPNSSLIIFNRWGNKVYETDNYQNDWNGTDSKGRELPAGIYYYILRVQAEEYLGNLEGYPTGFVTIVR